VNRHFNWRPRQAIIGTQLSPLLKSWLDTPDSLTARVKASCRPCFSLRVHAEAWQRPYVDEARRLQMPLWQEAWVRVITLRCGDVPWVLGRTVMPRDSLRGRRSRLRSLGTRPLGSVLFTGREVVRSAIEVRRLEADDPLVDEHRTAGGKPLPLWARRSTLAILGEPILVTEVFLPELEYGAAYRQDLD
jgi:chorismate--pyruvate lyase